MKTTASHDRTHDPALAGQESRHLEHRAEILWHAAQRYAALHTGTTETPDYWKTAMDRLLELVAAETLREDAASFGLRRWSRLNAHYWQAPVALFDALALNSARGWRLFGQSIRPC
jgi:hypothetical protein